MWIDGWLSNSKTQVPQSPSPPIPSLRSPNTVTSMDSLLNINCLLSWAADFSLMPRGRAPWTLANIYCNQTIFTGISGVVRHAYERTPPVHSYIFHWNVALKPLVLYIYDRHGGPPQEIEGLGIRLPLLPTQLLPLSRYLVISTLCSYKEVLCITGFD